MTFIVDAAPAGGPRLTLAEAQAHSEKLGYPHVTKEHIESCIGKIEYLTSDTLTICIIYMKNGFKQIGKAAPADPRNFNPEVGQRYAYEDAMRGLWHLEGYLLCQRIYETVMRDLPGSH